MSLDIKWYKQLLWDDKNKRLSLRRFVAFWSFISFISLTICNLFLKILVQKIYIYLLSVFLLMALGVLSGPDLAKIVKAIRGVKDDCPEEEQQNDETTK